MRHISPARQQAALSSLLPVLFLLLTLGASAPTHAGKIIKCLDANGTTVFTFHKRDCAPEEPLESNAAEPSAPDALPRARPTA